MSGPSIVPMYLHQCPASLQSSSRHTKRSRHQRLPSGSLSHSLTGTATCLEPIAAPQKARELQTEGRVGSSPQKTKVQNSNECALKALEGKPQTHDFPNSWASAGWLSLNWMDIYFGFSSQSKGRDHPRSTH